MAGYNTMDGLCLLLFLQLGQQKENLEALDGTMGPAIPGISAFLNNRVNMLSTSSAEQGPEKLD